MPINHHWSKIANEPSKNDNMVINRQFLLSHNISNVRHSCPIETLDLRHCIPIGNIVRRGYGEFLEEMKVFWVGTGLAGRMSHGKPMRQARERKAKMKQSDISEWVIAVERMATELEEGLKGGNHIKIPEGEKGEQWERLLGEAQSHAADVREAIGGLIDLT